MPFESIGIQPLWDVRIRTRMIQFNTHHFKLITITHKNTLLTDCPVKRVHITLHQIFEDLKSPAFIFAGRSYIINIDHVDRITTAAIYLEDGIKIQAGAETIQDVKTQIMEYWRNVE